MIKNNQKRRRIAREAKKVHTEESFASSLYSDRMTVRVPYVTKTEKTWIRMVNKMFERIGI